MPDSDEWRVFTRAGFVWRSQAGAPEELVDRLLALRNGVPDEAEIIKQNPKRTVFRLEAAGQEFYAKWHRFRGGWDALLARVRGTRAERELKMAHILKENGLPVVAPVLIGERTERGLPRESFFVTRGIDGISIAEMAGGQSCRTGVASPAERRALVGKLGALVRDLHEAGVHHPDLHCDNILATHPSRELCLLDLHAARAFRRLSRPRRVQSLAFLCNSFRHYSIGATEPLRFLKAYGRQEATPAALDALSAAIRDESAQILARHIRSRSRRCMIHSSVFTHERTPRGRVYRRRATPLEHVFSIIDRHRQIMSGREFGEVVKRHPKTYITRLRFPEADGETFYVKEFIRSGARRLLPRRRRHAPALTSWRAALAMTVRGIPAPEAVAVLLGNRASSYLIMRAVGDAEPLVDAIHRAVGPSVPLRRRRDFLRAAADFLMKCYAAGVFHCDLKSGNVLLRELPSGGWEFVLLDLAAVKFPRRISLDSKILNLAQLNASIPTTLTWTDRLRFLRHMAEHEPLLGERSSMLDIARITRRRNCPWAPR